MRHTTDEVNGYLGWLEGRARMSLRDRILEATTVLLKEEGLATIRSKRIAEAAGCSEGAIFKHFGTKGGLLAAVLAAGLPETQALFETIDRAKHSDLRIGLVAVVQALRAFYLASTPILQSAFADRQLFTHYQQAHRVAGTGPQQTWGRLASYLREVHARGLITDGLDLELESLMIAGVCQHTAWVELVDGVGQLPHSGLDLAERLVDDQLLPVLTGVRSRPSERP